MNAIMPDILQNGKNMFTTLSWRVIFAGTLLGISISILLNLIGGGLGLLSYGYGLTRLDNIGFGAIIWEFIAGIISMFLAGSISGLFTGIYGKFNSVCHAVMIWGLSMLLSILLATTTVGGMFSGIGNITSQAFSSKSVSQIKDQVKNNLQKQDENVDSGDLKNKMQAGVQVSGGSLLLLSLYLVIVLISAIGGAILYSNYSKKFWTVQ